MAKQELGGLLDLALAEKPAHARGRDGASLRRHERMSKDVEAALLAQGSHCRYRSRAAGAKAEVLAHMDGRRRKNAAQDLGDVAVVRERRKLRREAVHENGVRAGESQ